MNRKHKHMAEKAMVLTLAFSLLASQTPVIGYSAEDTGTKTATGSALTFTGGKSETATGSAIGIEDKTENSYLVWIEPSEYGTTIIDSDKYEAGNDFESAPGEKIVLIAEPNDGYKFSSYELTDFEGNPINLVFAMEEEGVFSFEMPESDVIVNTTYKETEGLMFATAPVVDNAIAQGTTDGIDWVIDEFGVLTLVGAGELSSDTDVTEDNRLEYCDWLNYADEITAVYCDCTLPENCAYFFCCIPADSIEFGPNFDASQVIVTDYMFAGTGFTELDLSSWAPADLVSAANMFNGSSVEYLNMSGWDFSKVNGDYYNSGFSNFLLGNLVLKEADFSYCDFTGHKSLIGLDGGDGISDSMSALPALERINFSHVIAPDATDFGHVYPSLTSRSPHNYSEFINLVSIDFSYADLSSITDFTRLFAECSSLQEVDFTETKLGTITSAEAMFRGCVSLQSIDDIAGFKDIDWSSNESMYQMFEGCTAFTDVDLSGMNFTSVKTTGKLFENCTNMKTVNLSNTDLASNTSFSCTFYGTTALETVDFTGIITSAITNTSQMFYGSGITGTFDMSPVDLKNVTNARDMFRDCHNVDTVLVPTFEKAATTTNMFANCRSLTRIYLNPNGWPVSDLLGINYHDGIADYDDDTMEPITYTSGLVLSGWYATVEYRWAEAFYCDMTGKVQSSNSDMFYQQTLSLDDTLNRDIPIEAILDKLTHVAKDTVASGYQHTYQGLTVLPADIISTWESSYNNSNDPLTAIIARGHNYRAKMIVSEAPEQRIYIESEHGLVATAVLDKTTAKAIELQTDAEGNVFFMAQGGHSIQVTVTKTTADGFTFTNASTVTETAETVYTSVSTSNGTATLTIPSSGATLTLIGEQYEDTLTPVEYTNEDISDFDLSFYNDLVFVGNERYTAGERGTIELPDTFIASVPFSYKVNAEKGYALANVYAIYVRNKRFYYAADAEINLQNRTITINSKYPIFIYYTFNEVDTYDVNVTVKNGIKTVDTFELGSFEEGAIVSDIYTPETGYRIDSITSDTVTVTDGSFEMPANDVEVIVNVVEDVYTITNDYTSLILVNEEDDKINKVKPNELVTLSLVQPGLSITQGNVSKTTQLLSYSVVDSAGNEIEIINNQFTMPEDNVTITAETITLHRIYIQVFEWGDFKIEVNREYNLLVDFPDVFETTQRGTVDYLYAAAGDVIETSATIRDEEYFLDRVFFSVRNERTKQYEYIEKGQLYTMPDDYIRMIPDTGYQLHYVEYTTKQAPYVNDAGEIALDGNELYTVGERGTWVAPSYYGTFDWADEIPTTITPMEGYKLAVTNVFYFGTDDRWHENEPECTIIDLETGNFTIDNLSQSAVIYYTFVDTAIHPSYTVTLPATLNMEVEDGKLATDVDYTINYEVPEGTQIKISIPNNFDMTNENGAVLTVTADKNNASWDINTSEATSNTDGTYTGAGSFKLTAPIEVGTWTGNFTFSVEITQ